MSADLCVFATPHGFSQLVTSFFASESLGIPRTLLLNFLVSSSIVKDFYLYLYRLNYTFDSSLFSLICLVFQYVKGLLRLSRWADRKESLLFLPYHRDRSEIA